MAYAEYPKAMVHPNYAPAQIERPSPGRPLLPGEAPQAPKSAVFPPVTVMNADQEGQHRALGYTSAAGDPSAHEPGGTEMHEYQEYPKWVGDVIVNSAEEETALKPAKIDAKEKPDLSELRAEYEKAFGKKPFNGWSAKVLKEKIDAA